MSRRKRGMMSEELKTELAKELGFMKPWNVRAGVELQLKTLATW